MCYIDDTCLLNKKLIFIAEIIIYFKLIISKNHNQKNKYFSNFQVIYSYILNNYFY